MITACEVYLWGTRIGVIYQDNHLSPGRFEYDKKFLNSGIELSPFMMPLSGRIYSFPELVRLEAFHGLPGLFADSLPDKFGNAVIEQWLISHGRSISSFSAIERLCYTGKRGMGALEYVPATETAASDEDIDVTDMVEFKVVQHLNTQLHELPYNGPGADTLPPRKDLHRNRTGSRLPVRCPPIRRQWSAERKKNLYYRIGQGNKGPFRTGTSIASR